MDRAAILKKLDKFIGGAFVRILSSAKPSQVGAVKNILLIKTVAIGDLVLLLPTIKALKQQFPKAKLSILTTPRVKEVVEGFPFLDEIIYYDILGKDKGLSGLRRIIRTIKELQFDLSIDFEHYYNFTAIICRLAGIKNMAGFAITKQIRQKFFNIKIPYYADKHEVEAFFEAVKSLQRTVLLRRTVLKHREGLSPKEELSLVQIAVTDNDNIFVDKFLKDNNISNDDLLVCVHPSTSTSARIRRWLPERFAKVIDSLIKDYKAKVIITGTADDKEVIDEILRGQSPLNWTGDSPRPLPTPNSQLPTICTDFSLKQFAQLCRRCDLFISVDTGPMHIAAAMGAKTIGLFGPNTPDKWGPYGFENLAIYKKLDCSPCTKQYLGQISNCKTGDCMKAIISADVLERVNKVLGKQSAKGDTRSELWVSP